MRQDHKLWQFFQICLYSGGKYITFVHVSVPARPLTLSDRVDSLWVNRSKSIKQFFIYLLLDTDGTNSSLDLQNHVNPPNSVYCVYCVTHSQIILNGLLWDKFLLWMISSPVHHSLLFYHLLTAMTMKYVAATTKMRGRQNQIRQGSCKTNAGS